MNPTKIIITISIAAIMTIYLVYPVIENPTQSGNTLDIIVIDGQSNAEYNQYCDANKVDLPVPDHKLLYYGSETAVNSYPGSSSTGAYEMCRDGYWKIGGLEPSLAYYYSLKSNNSVLTINVARGGMSIEWLAGEGLDYAKNIIKEALEDVRGYNTNFVGWVMLQGEADSSMDVETYKTYFLQIKEYYDSIGAEDCFIAKTRAQWGGNSVIAQNELCNEYPTIHMATTVSDSFADGGPYVMPVSIHYTQLGRNIIGEDLGLYIAAEDEIPGQSILWVIPTFIVIALILMIVKYVIIDKNND